MAPARRSRHNGGVTPPRWPALLLAAMLLLAAAAPQAARDGQLYVVALDGSDANPGTEALPWRTVQKACNATPPGSTVAISAGTYNEKVVVRVSGDEVFGFITFRPYGDGPVVIDGSGREGANIVLIENRSFLRFEGLTLTKSRARDGSGVRVIGAGEHIELLGLTITEIRGSDAMGITVYGTSAVTPISDLFIDGNEIADCEPAESEALVVNGNVVRFAITNNVVHDVDNIGIDMIGGEGVCPEPANDAARQGICRGNVVYRARSSYGGGFAAGIYVDGGRDIVVENNLVTECDIGLEVGAENRKARARNVVVRNNVVTNNDKIGLAFGGYDYDTTGKVLDCVFANNTVVLNDTLRRGFGEVLVQVAENNRFVNNLVVASKQGLLLTTPGKGAVGNTFDYNLYFVADPDVRPAFFWNGQLSQGWGAYLDASGQDAHSLLADPLLVRLAPAEPDLHLLRESPARDAGDPSYLPAPAEADVDGQPRLFGVAVDIGADEIVTSERPARRRLGTR